MDYRFPTNCVIKNNIKYRNDALMIVFQLSHRE
jgi:hypothetical protein